MKEFSIYFRFDIVIVQRFNDRYTCAIVDIIHVLCEIKFNSQRVYSLIERDQWTMAISLPSISINGIFSIFNLQWSTSKLLHRWHCWRGEEVFKEDANEKVSECWCMIMTDIKSWTKYIFIDLISGDYVVLGFAWFLFGLCASQLIRNVTLEHLTIYEMDSRISSFILPLLKFFLFLLCSRSSWFCSIFSWTNRTILIFLLIKMPSEQMQYFMLCYILCLNHSKEFTQQKRENNFMYIANFVINFRHIYTCCSRT